MGSSSFGGRIKFILKREKKRYLPGGSTTSISTGTVVVGESGLLRKTGHVYDNVDKGLSGSNYNGTTGSSTVILNVMPPTGCVIKEGIIFRPVNE